MSPPNPLEGFESCPSWGPVSLCPMRFYGYKSAPNSLNNFPRPQLHQPYIERFGHLSFKYLLTLILWAC